MPSFSQILAQSVTDAGVKATVVYATAADLPLVGNTAGDIALVSETHRLYIFTGAGWYNVALINTNPTIITAPDGSYEFATDGTPIVITLQAQDPEEVPIVWSYVVTSGVLGSTATVHQEDNVFTITPSTDPNDTGGFSITFTASDGVNLATAVSTFTLLFGAADQYYNNNSLLVKSGSTAGLNNTSFVDGSTNDFTVTSGGDVYQGSYSPYSPAGWGVYFDGTGDYLTLNTSTELTGEFTLELWLYLNDVTSGRYIISQAINSSVTSNWGISSTGFTMQLYGGVRGNQNGTLAYNVASLVGSWNHLALEFNGSNSYQVFVNGVSIGTQPNITSPWHSEGIDAFTVIGAYWYNAPTQTMNGVISNLCITKGLRKYGTNFTPPTYPFTTDANTALLIAQSNRFIDNSTNNSTITKYGDTKVVPFSPYLPSEKYVPTLHGGSAYFDGSGDILIVPTVASSELNFATGCSIEGWSYITSYNNYGFIFDTWQGTGNFVGWWFVGHSNTGTWRISPGNATAIDTGIPMVLNQWNHWVLTNDGSTSRFFVNGVLLNATSVTPGDIDQYFVFSSYGGGNNGQYPIVGYLSGMRFIKGAVNIPVLYQTSSTTTGATIFVPSTEIPNNASGTGLLLNMNNAGIYDETAKNNIKVIGNTTTSTTQTKYNDTAMYFDGNGDYLIMDVLTGQFGTGDFTIEYWDYHGSQSTNYGCQVGTLSSATPVGTWRFGTFTNNAGVTFAYHNGSSYVDVHFGSVLYNDSAWRHFALTRQNGTVRAFVNGVQVGSNQTVTQNFNSSNKVILGAELVNPTYFNGYIEDLRITKGFARYTTDFTPPTAPLGFDNEE